MKRLLVIIIFLSVSFLAACSASKTAGNEAADYGRLEEKIMLESGIWPENEYTAGIPVPPGSVSWAMLDPQCQNCAVSLTGVAEKDYEEYIASLEQNGFTVMEEVCEEIAEEDYVSIGTLYFDGERWLSISRIPDCLSIYIAFAES